MMKKKPVKKKCITKMKFFQRLSPNSVSSGRTSGCGCENTIQMLRKNNQNLARALSDQKIETNQWYSEAVALRGELQELQEKLVRVPDNNMNIENVIGDTAKQIKEYYDLIDKDFNSALDKIIQVVDKVTKIKQLVSGAQNACQVSTNFFTRTPGARISLGTSGSLSSPRQRAVPPMVSGHVLQPALVPLPKLKINFNNGRRLYLVGEENDSAMPIIGEHSSASPENGEVSEGQQSPEAEDVEPEEQSSPEGVLLDLQSANELDTTQSPPTPGQGTPKKKSRSSRGKTNMSPGTEVTMSVGATPTGSQDINRSIRGRARGRRRSISRASKSPSKGLEISPAVTFDDPLEGPSWLLDVGRSPFRSQGRRAKRQRQCAKVSDDVNTMESSDEDIDESEDISSKFVKKDFPRSKSRKKRAALLAKSQKFSPSLSLDHSCLESPNSTPVSPETVKVQGKQRSEKSQTTKLSTNKISLEVSKTREQKKLNSSRVQDTGHSPKPQLSELGKRVVCNGSLDTIDEHSQSPNEVDQTCKIVTNMDLTIPVSFPVLTQEDSVTSVGNKVLQDDIKSTQVKKKFFKKREAEETCDEIPTKGERTPFDLSMLNDSAVKMPPFSSTRTTEKENLPPHSPEINEHGNLCNVSVVLEDVMKQSVYSETTRETPKLTPKESQSVKLMSSSGSRKSKSASAANHSGSSSEVVKPKRFRKNQCNALVGSASNPEHKTQKRSAKRTSTEETPTNTKQDSGGKKPRVTPSDRIRMHDLEECFVLVHRTPLLDSYTPRMEKNIATRKNLKSSLSVLSNREDEEQQQQQQQEQPPPLSSENVRESNEQTEEEEKDEEEEADAGYEVVDIASSPIPSPHPHIPEPKTNGIENQEEEEEVEKRNTVVEEGEDRDVVLDNEDNHIEGTNVHTEKLPNKENHNNIGSPDKHREFEGFEEPQRSKSTLKRIKVNPIRVTNEEEKEILVKYGGKRRAALKISSFKEASLNRKIRRGKNNEVITSDAEGNEVKSTSNKVTERTQKKAKKEEKPNDQEKENAKSIDKVKVKAKPKSNEQGMVKEKAKDISQEKVKVNAKSIDKVKVKAKPKSIGKVKVKIKGKIINQGKVKVNTKGTDKVKVKPKAKNVDQGKGKTKVKNIDQGKKKLKAKSLGHGIQKEREKGLDQGKKKVKAKSIEGGKEKEWDKIIDQYMEQSCDQGEEHEQVAENGIENGMEESADEGLEREPSDDQGQEMEESKDQGQGKELWNDQVQEQSDDQEMEQSFDQEQEVNDDQGQDEEEEEEEQGQEEEEEEEQEQSNYEIQEIGQTNDHEMEMLVNVSECELDDIDLDLFDE